MASEVTRIADVIVPEVFSQYVIEYIKEKSALFRSGIAMPNPVLDDLITGGGKTITLPAFKSLTGDSQVLDDTTALETKKLASKADVAAVLYRGQAWSSNELAGALSGTDPAAVTASLVGDYWLREDDKTLVSVLKGVFAATTMADLVTGDENAYYDANLLIDGQGKLGDAADNNLSAIVMHSAVRNDLLKKDKTAFESWTERGILFNKFLGYDVVIDDSCPYDVEKQTYTSYLFARGAVSLGTGTPAALTLTETDRDSLASNDILINRRAYVIHVNGTKWTGTAAGATPTNTELETGTNWERVSDIKNIGVVAVVGKIGASGSGE